MNQAGPSDMPSSPRTGASAPSHDLPDTIVPADTRTRLLQAAMSEFIEAGFAGTDTNRIARRAGFAPQTFYRWFADKAAIFLAVLSVWEEVESALLHSVIVSPDVDAMQMAEACVESFRPFLTFRRNLRAVMASQAEIRAVRAQGRRRLLSSLSALNTSLPVEEMGSLLVQFEQLCEALAQGEFDDLGLSGDAAMHTLAKLVQQLRTH
jgi:AcrR family transcriptional regulator